MDSSKWHHIKSLMAAALDAPAESRAAFLAREPDAEIRRAVEKLLAAHERAGDFIDAPLFSGGSGGARGADDFEENFVGRRIDDYVILEKLGEGGMGAVYLAEHRGEDFSQQAALKLIKRGMDTNSVVRRFLMERRILAQLEHANIARLLDGGTTTEGLPYFVMEYVAGESIKKFCARRELSTNEILKLFAKVCRAVSYAHQKLVIHRDLKPSNIIVTESGEPKLLDFGIAKLFTPDWDQAEPTLANLRMMTPEYASPEQMRGEMSTTASDVYSLGVVLYELLTGARPFEFDAQNAPEFSERLPTAEPVRPSSVVSRAERGAAASGKETNRPGRRTTDEAENPNPKSKIKNPKSLRGDLDNIVLKAIRREPAERYRSVEEFGDDIRLYLAGLPVRATGDSARYRFSKFVRRNRRAVSAAALVSLVIFTLSGLAVFQSVSAMRERDKANRRYEKLRDVARLLMTETRESLYRVPGTMQVQRSLAEKSVELLDGIYDETTTDAAFLSELADSYGKLCRMQFRQYREFEKADASCRKSVEIRRRIVNLEPANRQRKFELVGALGVATELSQMRGERAQSIAQIAEVTAIYRAAAEAEPTAENLSQLALHLLGTADTFEMWDMPDEAAALRRSGGEILRKLIDAAERRKLSAAEQTELAWQLLWQGGIFRKLGDDERALQTFGRAAELARTAYEADRSLQFAFNHTSRAHREMGEIYEKQGRFEKALEMYRFSFDWLKTRETDAGQIKANYFFGVHFYANRCALILRRLGRQKEADEIIEKPFRDYAAFLDLDEDGALLTYAHEPFLDLTRYYSETKRFDRGAQVWERQIARLQKFLDRNPDDLLFMNYHANAEARLGDIFSDFDAATESFRTTDRARLKKARAHFEKAASIYARTQSLYAPTETEKTARQTILRKIERLSARF